MLRGAARPCMIELVHNLIIVIVATCVLIPKGHDIDDLLRMLFLFWGPNTAVGQQLLPFFW